MAKQPVAPKRPVDRKVHNSEATRAVATHPRSRTLAAPDPETAYRLQFAVSLLARRLRREIGTGLTPSQLSILSTVARAGPLSLGDLADCERVAPPTITRVVAKLEGAGYLERLEDPTDRRVTRVQLTQDARRLVDTARQAKAEWVLERLERLTPAQQRRLIGAVDDLELLAEME